MNHYELFKECKGGCTLGSLAKYFIRATGGNGI